MRTITDHHDGHGLNESIEIVADAPGHGGASHLYELSIDGTPIADIQFQKGPRNVKGSTPGATEAALAAVLIDRLQAFQAGAYACHENEMALQMLRGALGFMKARADARAERGVLGTYAK